MRPRSSSTVHPRWDIRFGKRWSSTARSLSRNPYVNARSPVQVRPQVVYDANMEPKETYSCGAVVWRRVEGPVAYELLLIKQFQHRDSWGIPKGHMNEGETHAECALREVKEEAGVDVTLGQLLPEVSTIWNNERKRVVSYLARQIDDQEPNCNDPDCEVAEVRWFSINALPRIHVYQRPLISHAIKVLLDQASILE